jgi:hypothetical protein
VRWFWTILLLLGPLAAAVASDAVTGLPRQSDSSRRSLAKMEVATGRVAKVLTFFVDTNGCIAKSPSLFDRDAYQARLRQHPNGISALRLDVLWKASHAAGTELKLRAELRGIGANGLPRQAALETNVAPHFFRRWTSLTLGGADWKNFGSLVAWRVSLWDGDRLLGEQKSFLW